MKSIRASETITQKHSDAYRSSWGDRYVLRIHIDVEIPLHKISNNVHYHTNGQGHLFKTGLWPARD
ncbi:hypothetical protein T05_10429 [Trichinella murrelli]|uniref:Uncharacterized protein n=1 Tax=Trichinella murrelli TaxID=144512 RepID=A0A0V0SS88_9BILA|nr:hypothetical protein T05_10429 [Trichinella murrelli]